MKMKTGPLLSLALAMGLLSQAASGLAAGAKTSMPGNADVLLAAASAVDDEEEDDEEEEAVDYRDRVREMQEWINRRDVERKQGLEGLPQPNPPALAAPYPKYFQDRGYDENGYRRLDGDIRVKLRDAPDYEPSYNRHAYRHSRWHGRHGHNRHYYRGGRRSHHSRYALSHSHHSRPTAHHHGSKSHSGHSRKRSRR